MNHTRRLTTTDTLRSALVALLGFASGTVNGLLGAAGGVLLALTLPHLPIPSWLGDHNSTLSPVSDRRDLLATVLAVMLPVSAVSAFLYWQRGMGTDPSLLWASLIPAMLGGLVGAMLLDRIPREAMRKIFALVVVVAGLRMLF
jgi:uncharacterized membrane protein YfcA